MNKLLPRILIYDFVIVTLFSMLAWVIATGERSVLCVCFTSNFGPIISYILGLFFIVVLCFMNHSKNKKEPAPKWYGFIIYLVVALIIFIIVNIVIVMFGETFDIGGYGSSF